MLAVHGRTGQDEERGWSASSRLPEDAFCPPPLVPLFSLPILPLPLPRTLGPWLPWTEARMSERRQASARESQCERVSE